jgi:hypothetical protein
VVIDAGRSRAGWAGEKVKVYLCEVSALQEEGGRVGFTFSGIAPCIIGFSCSVIASVELGLITRISIIFVLVDIVSRSPGDVGLRGDDIIQPTGQPKRAPSLSAMIGCSYLPI